MSSYYNYGNYPNYSYYQNSNHSDFNSQDNVNSNWSTPQQASDSKASTSSQQSAQPKHKKKKGGIIGFFRGIVHGLVNTVKSLFTPKGLLMAIASVGLICATGGAALPVLAAVGMGMGGKQMLKGIKSGNSEAVGEGFFTFASSAMGVKATPSPITIGEGATAKSYTLASAKAGKSAGFLDQLKAPFGLSKYKSANGEELNIYSLAWKKAQSRFSTQADSAASYQSSTASTQELSTAAKAEGSVSENLTTEANTNPQHSSISQEQEAQSAETARIYHAESPVSENLTAEPNTNLPPRSIAQEQEAQDSAIAEGIQQQEQQAQQAELLNQKKSSIGSTIKMKLRAVANKFSGLFQKKSIKFQEKGGKLQLTHKGASNRVVKVNNASVSPNSTTELKPGNIVQIDNRLFKVTPDHKPFTVSDDAELAHELFPNGLHKIIFEQGGIGDCYALSEMQSLLEDPSGKGTQAVLSRISRTEDAGYRVTFGNGQNIRLKGKKFYRDNDGNPKFRIKDPNTDGKMVKGDLGVQVLERAYYRSLKEQKFPDKFTMGTRRPPTLSDNVLKMDKTHFGEDFAIPLLGDEWKPVTIDGCYTENLSPKHAYQPSSFSDKFKTADATSQEWMNSVFDQIEHSPENMRLSAYSTPTPNLEKEFVTSQGQHLFADHAYYLKGISRDLDGNRVFNLVNPHDSSTTIPIPETEFLDGFTMLHGVRHQSYSLVDPPSNSSVLMALPEAEPMDNFSQLDGAQLQSYGMA